MWRPRFARIAAGIVFLIGTWFVGAFRVNLHCTQYTSFRLAVFDMEPHVEEAIEHEAPLVYRTAAAIPLRIYFGATILAFLFAPSAGAAAVLRSRQRLRTWLTVLAGLTAVVVGNTLLPAAIVGERFSALGAFAIVIMILPVTVLGIALRLVDRGKSLAG